jgi:REP element-mobilizing transposase RayT
VSGAPASRAAWARSAREEDSWPISSWHDARATGPNGRAPRPASRTGATRPPWKRKGFVAEFKLARRSLQLELPAPRRWGGARRGAGRPRTSDRLRSVPHVARPEHKPRYPVHVTFRARPGIESLRNAKPFAALTAAIAAASNRCFRSLHFSVQSNHVHALVEADDRGTLSVGVAALKVRAARTLNRALRRRGPVWDGKYHAHPLRTPRETRRALVYVLQNWRKHIRGASGVDGRSSGPWFDGWIKAPTPPAAPSPVALPRTWLALKGWRERGGGPIGQDEIPAPKTEPGPRKNWIARRSRSNNGG